jgi:F0F1-type ATP synthase assembly protein I
MGQELAGAILGFAFVGTLIGRYFGSARWGLIVGATLGVVGGLYNLVRQALKLSRQESRRSDSGAGPNADRGA